MDQEPPARPRSGQARRGAAGKNDALAPRAEREPVYQEPRTGPYGLYRAPAPAPIPRFDPPLSVLGPLFRHRLERIHLCRVPYTLDINPRATNRVLGGYYKSRRLVRIYAVDLEQGRRPLEELFDTFLHEIAHHLEYTEPQSFAGKKCLRVPGRMHSRLFWRIFGDLKQQWARLQERPG